MLNYVSRKLYWQFYTTIVAKHPCLLLPTKLNEVCARQNNLKMTCVDWRILPLRNKSVSLTFSVTLIDHWISLRILAQFSHSTDTGCCLEQPGYHANNAFEKKKNSVAREFFVVLSRFTCTNATSRPRWKLSQKRLGSSTQTPEIFKSLGSQLVLKQTSL